MRIRILGAKGWDHVAVRIGDKLFARTPYGDVPFRHDGIGPDMMKAALLAKWGFSEVVGEDGKPDPEIDEGEYPAVEETTPPDGDRVFVLRGAIPFEPEERPMPPPYQPHHAPRPRSE